MSIVLIILGLVVIIRCPQILDYFFVGSFKASIAGQNKNIIRIVGFVNGYSIIN